MKLICIAFGLVAAFALSSCQPLDGTTWTYKDGVIVMTPPSAPIVIPVDSNK